MFSPLKEAYTHLTPEEVRNAFADSHPIIFEHSKVESFESYILKYLAEHPEKLRTLPKSYGLSYGSKKLIPSCFHVYSEPDNLERVHYLSPSCNSTLVVEMKHSDHTFVLLSYSNPTPVGTDDNAITLNDTIARFMTIDDLKSFLRDLEEYEYLEGIKDREFNFTVYSISSCGSWSGQHICDSQLINQIFLKESIKQTIMTRIQKFKTEQERAKRFGKPYKLNMLFYGIPGSGKTSLVKAIAKQLKKYLYIFNFSKELTDNRMNSLISQINSESVLVFEDVDSFFINRESNGCNISFSSLINQLDGIRNSDSGLITILTANHVDKLDPALLRAGRIDLIVKFDYPTKEEIKMAFDVYLDHLSSEERDRMFIEWYPLVEDQQITMSAYTDFFYRDYENIIEKTKEFLEEQQHLKEIMMSGKNESCRDTPYYPKHENGNETENESGSDNDDTF